MLRDDVIAATRPVVFGAAYSVYVQTLRLCLEEKGVDYDVVEVDVFHPGGCPPEQFRRHPFGRIPAFAHGDFEMYETAPTCRYVDEAFDGPPLQPATVRGRARMGQVISILDNYAYASLVWGVYDQEIALPREGRRTDPDRRQAAVARASTCLSALDRLCADAQGLAGDALTLADLHAVPMFGLFLKAPSASALMDRAPRLRAWWSLVSTRASVQRIVDPSV